MAIQLGQQLGNYKLISLLGSGGFGEVYLGEHIHLGTSAAIKVLGGKLSQQELEDFKNEARTIKSLKHSHIVQLLEFGIENNITPFMVMDYAPNGTLRDRHPQGTQVPLVTVVSYVKQIAEALQYAHDSKIIHRDIKPENIFVGNNNEILVGDFGIAVMAHSTKTMRPQVPIGTPGYAAPEQAQGLARPASDQYALGIMVCEWLSGISPPFPQGIKIPAISPAVEQVVFKALSQVSKQRYPRIQDFANALEKASNPPLPQAAALPQIVGAPIQPVPPPVPQLQGVSPAERLYREGVLAQSAGDIERAADLWEQSLNAQGNRNVNTRGLLRGLARKRIALRVQQAHEAKSVGDWQREIDIWNEIIRLKRYYYFNGSHIDEDRYKVEQRKIVIARQNLEYRWLYEHTQQLINNGNSQAAKAALKSLWQFAPSYGDPLGLAKKVGLRVKFFRFTFSMWLICYLVLSIVGLFILIIYFHILH
jgi:serine/threonine protein kinase